MGEKKYIVYIIFLRSVCRLLVTANVVPSSAILVTLMMEVMHSSESSVLAKTTRHDISKTAFLKKWLTLMEGKLFTFFATNKSVESMKSKSYSSWSSPSLSDFANFDLSISLNLFRPLMSYARNSRVQVYRSHHAPNISIQTIILATCDEELKF
jgi:hypothetical protein